MKSGKSKLIMGTAIGLAAIAVAIDHTRHSLPTPEAGADFIQEKESFGGGYNPCSLENPCSLDNPCSLNTTPCGLN